MNIGERIKSSRESLSLTQPELAERCGWGHNQARISHYETGKRNPTPEDLVSLEDALNLHRGALLGAEPPNHSEGVATQSGKAPSEQDFINILSKLSDSGLLKVAAVASKTTSPKAAMKLAKIYLDRAEEGL